MIKIAGGRLRLSPKQIRLEELFTVDRILGSKGFQIESENSNHKTIFQKDLWTLQEGEMIFQIFDSLEFRRQLLSYILDEKDKQISNEVKALISLPEFNKDRESFSRTFEWYVGELMVRKFKSFSSSSGVTVKMLCRGLDSNAPGDYDVLSILGNLDVFYVECKTKKCHENDIRNSIERSKALHCKAAVIFRDSGFNENNLKGQIKSLAPQYDSGLNQILKINLKRFPESLVYQWEEIFFVHSNAEADKIEERIRTVLRTISARTSLTLSSTVMVKENYEGMGFDCSEIEIE